MKSIFITGGAGYVGSQLVPFLLNKGYKVTVYDIMYFGDNFLPKKNKNLNIIKGDIRDKDKLFVSCENHDVFINLACISNDTSFVLDEKLSKSIKIRYQCAEIYKHMQIYTRNVLKLYMGTMGAMGPWP